MESLVPPNCPKKMTIHFHQFLPDMTTLRVRVPQF
jgi:hypothetical protein